MSGGSPLAFVADHGRFRRVHDDLWTYHVDLRAAGVPLGRRMTAVRAGGRWLLLGPLVPDDVARAELEAGGRVDVLAVPNAFHNRFVRRAAAIWPETRVLLAPNARREGIDPERVDDLPPRTPGPWTDDLSTIRLDGLPRIGEHVFVHRPSGSLIVADLCFGLDARYPWTTRLLFRLTGAYPGPAMSRLFRGFVRDRDALRESLDRVLDERFDRIVVAHGEIVEHGGREAIERIRDGV